MSSPLSPNQNLLLSAPPSTTPGERFIGGKGSLHHACRVRRRVLDVVLAEPPFCAQQPAQTKGGRTHRVRATQAIHGLRNGTCSPKATEDKALPLPNTAQVIGFIGGSCWARTNDQWIKSPRNKPHKPLPRLIISFDFPLLRINPPELIMPMNGRKLGLEGSPAVP